MTEKLRTQRAIANLASLVRECQVEAGIRPWDEPGIAAELRRPEHGNVPLAALAWAAIRAALDSRNDTPVVLHLGNRAWEAFDPWPCKTHPECKSRRTNGECGACWADRNASRTPGQIRDRGGSPIPAEARTAMKR